MGNAFAGLGIGLATSLGYNVPSPIDKYKSQLANIQNETQTFINVTNLKVFGQQKELSEDLINYINVVTLNSEASSQYMYEILREGQQTQSVFILIVFVLTVILLVFNLT